MIRKQNSDDLAVLTAAFGSRPIYGKVWIIWFLVGASIVLLQDQEKASTTYVAIAVCGLGAITVIVSLISGLLSKSRRKYLLSPRNEPKRIGLVTKALVWVVPILVVVAILMPKIIL